MQFETQGDAKRPAILFFHAMGVTGASSEPVAKNLQARYFCILPTSTVYCAGQKYVSKADEVRQVEAFCAKKAWKGWRWSSLLPSARTWRQRFWPRRGFPWNTSFLTAGSSPKLAGERGA